MAASVTQVPPYSVGQLWAIPIDVVLGTNEYLVGGIAFGNDLPFNTIIGAAIVGVSGTGVGDYHAEVDIANEKLLLYSSLGTEETTTSTAVTVRLVVWGY